MASDPCLGMLGLARRAGKLAYGDELVRQMCADHKARCVLVAADAGESTAKRTALYAARANVPCITLPHGKDELGGAIGKNGCAVCAVSDIGMAAASIGKLAAQYPQYAEVAAQLGEKNARIQSRRGKKKPRNRDEQPKAEEKPSDSRRAAAPRKSNGGRPAAPRSVNGKRHFRKPGISSRQTSQHKPSENQRAKRVSDRKSPRSEAKR